MSDSRLFKPLKVGTLNLQHRIAMAPLTRFRVSDSFVPLPMVANYYAQRASMPGTLLIAEGTIVAPENGGCANVPGIYNQEQIDAWKRVTEAVHKKNSYIFLQLWAVGRVADKTQAERQGIEITSSSPIPLDNEHPAPRALTIDEIHQTTARYAQAAKNAMAAGFDGVEIHGANGYLLDQFTQDTVNQRTDAYGGSIPNRSRFAVEVTQAVADAVGANRTGIRLSPFSTFQGMKMAQPLPQFSDLITRLNNLGGLAYIHIVESRISGNADVESTEKLNPLVPLFDGPLLMAGGFTPDSARRLVDEEFPDRDVVVVFGRYFISTPDLPFRMERGLGLNPYDRNTFYTVGDQRGYVDYPFSKEFEEERESARASA